MVPKTCSFADCKRPVQARSLCQGHYAQQRQGRPLAELGGHSLTAGLSHEERFWFYVDKSADCWEWTGGRNSQGYGSINMPGRRVYAHRLAYEMAHGPIPPGIELDHKCHNPSCVRPTHLQAVSRKVNGENRAGAQRNSKTGIRGVTPHGQKWQATLTHNKKQIYIGLFATAAEAEAAVIAARNTIFSNNLNDRKVA